MKHFTAFLFGICCVLFWRMCVAERRLDKLEARPRIEGDPLLLEGKIAVDTNTLWIGITNRNSSSRQWLLSVPISIEIGLNHDGFMIWRPAK